MTALRSWNDDRALAAMVRVGKTHAEDLPAAAYANEELRVSCAALVRLAAALALDQSPHRGALEALLERKDDPSASVRLVITQRLERVAGAKGLTTVGQAGAL